SMSFARSVRSRFRAVDAASARVVMGAGALLSIGSGSAYAIPAFFPFLIHRLAFPSWHQTALSSAPGAVYYLLHVIIGPAADRIAARRITAVGQLLLIAGLNLIGLAGTEVAFEVTYLLNV